MKTPFNSWCRYVLGEEACDSILPQTSIFISGTGPVGVEAGNAKTNVPLHKPEEHGNRTNIWKLINERIFLLATVCVAGGD